VWGIDKFQKIYRWTGRRWQRIEGKAIHITVGPSGVWVVNNENNVYYRRGTYGDKNTAGSGVNSNKTFRQFLSIMRSLCLPTNNHQF
jgi:hypothetical protein